MKKIVSAWIISVLVAMSGFAGTASAQDLNAYFGGDFAVSTYGGVNGRNGYGVLNVNPYGVPLVSGSMGNDRTWVGGSITPEGRLQFETGLGGSAYGSNYNTGEIYASSNASRKDGLDAYANVRHESNQFVRASGDASAFGQTSTRGSAFAGGDMPVGRPKKPGSAFEK